MGVRVLVVDDNDAVAQATAAALEKAGFSPDIAFDGEEGLQMILANDYALVVTDVAMPRLNGTDMLARAQERKGRLRAVVLSGAGELPADLSHCAFLLKPVPFPHLLAAIEAELAKPL